MLLTAVEFVELVDFAFLGNLSTSTQTHHHTRNQNHDNHNRREMLLGASSSVRHDRQRRSPTVITWASNHKRRNADVCVGSSSPSLSWMIFLVIALSNFVVKQPECVPSELGETIGPLLQIKGLQTSVEKRFAVDIHVQLSKAHTHKRQMFEPSTRATRFKSILNLISLQQEDKETHTTKVMRAQPVSRSSHSRASSAASDGTNKVHVGWSRARRVPQDQPEHTLLATVHSSVGAGAFLRECGDGLGLMFHLFLVDVVAPGANERHRRCAPCEVLGSNPQTALSS